jgi:formamidopyrimidine-DNA glycosylase
MPELPDVEGFRRVFARHAAGRTVQRVEVLDRSMLRNRRPQALGRLLAGRRLHDPSRHGKWLLVPVGGGWLLVHFGMTGLLEWRTDGAERHAHDRLVLVCDRGELRYRNMRKLGGVWVARDDAERDRVTGPLGPDAHGLGREPFDELIAGRRGAVKAALMDQRLIAGLGNLMSDEALWRARVNPRAACRSLSARRRGALYDAVRATVRESIPAGRVPHGPKWLTAVRDQPNARCARCGASLVKATVAGRTACWCRRCQRR